MVHLLSNGGDTERWRTPDGPVGREWATATCRCSQCALWARRKAAAQGKRILAHDNLQFREGPRFILPGQRTEEPPLILVAGLGPYAVKVDRVPPPRGKAVVKDSMDVRARILYLWNGIAMSR